MFGSRSRLGAAQGQVPGSRRVALHYSRGLDLETWQERHTAGEVPDHWPYGLHHLATAGVRAVPARNSVLVRGIRKLAGGYDWHRLVQPGEVALCWDERAGVPVALSGAPTLTGVIWLTEHDRHHWTDPLARRALARSTTFVLSPRQLPELHERWGVPLTRSHFVPFGVDQEFWHPQDGENDGVLVVGNDRHRDHETAIQAVAAAGARLTLVTNHDVPVARVPFLNHRELRRAYADHAVVAVATAPNRHASGVTVLLEAMACARPVVATSGGGLEEYLTPGTGVLVPPGDVEAMSGAIQSLLADPDRAAALGSAGRAAVHKHFTTRVMATRLTELLVTL